MSALAVDGNDADDGEHPALVKSRERRAKQVKKLKEEAQMLRSTRTTPVDRKWCARTYCPKMIPLDWIVCKNRWCNSDLNGPGDDARIHAWRDRKATAAKVAERRRNATPEHKAAIAKWKANHPALVNAQKRRYYKRHYRRLLDIRDMAQWRIFLSQQRVQQEYDFARADATGELLELIEDQQADRDRVRRMAGDPWRMASLNAPMGADESGQLLDMLSGQHGFRGDPEWEDPTADYALALMEIEEELS